MPLDPKSVPGAFQYGGFWFITERSLMTVPHAVSCPPLDFLEAARLEPRLPDLSGAPIASWLLARVSSMTRGGMPYSYDQIVGSDGNDFDLGFTCHREDGSVIGSITFFANVERISLCAQAVPPNSPEILRDAIMKAVFSSPRRVAKTRVTVTWTDGANDAARTSVPQTYGYEEGSYLNGISPQHSIDWSEYD